MLREKVIARVSDGNFIGLSMEVECQKEKENQKSAWQRQASNEHCRYFAWLGSCKGYKCAHIAQIIIQ